MAALVASSFSGKRGSNCPWPLGKIETQVCKFLDSDRWNALIQLKKKKRILSSFLSGFISSRLFLPRQHWRHSAYSESEVIPAAGTQHCQFKSRWERSCHETTTAAKPYPFGLLSQPVTQATGTGRFWHVWFPGVREQHPCCCSVSHHHLANACSFFFQFPFLFREAELTQICHSAAGGVQTLGVLGVQLPGAREFPLGRWDLLGLDQGFKITAACTRTVLAVRECS